MQFHQQLCDLQQSASATVSKKKICLKNKRQKDTERQSQGDKKASSGTLGRPSAEGWSARSDDQSKGICNTICFQLKNLNNDLDKRMHGTKWFSKVRSDGIHTLSYCAWQCIVSGNKLIYCIHAKAAVPYSGISKSELALMPLWNEKLFRYSLKRHSHGFVQMYHPFLSDCSQPSPFHSLFWKHQHIAGKKRPMTSDNHTCYHRMEDLLIPCKLSGKSEAAGR